MFLKEVYANFIDGFTVTHTHNLISFLIQFNSILRTLNISSFKKKKSKYRKQLGS